MEQKNTNRSFLKAVAGVESTPEMRETFEKRTREHIARVAANMRLFEGYPGLDSDDLNRRGVSHDKSKFSSRELPGYVWVNEFHRHKRLGLPYSEPSGVKRMRQNAMGLHIGCNRHHPESHQDPNKMRLLDLAEMVADWTAMSQELKQNGGSCRKWAEENIGKWKFSESTKKKIFDLISYIDNQTLQRVCGGTHG